MSQLRHISVGKDGAVWGAGKTDGALFYRKGGLGDAWISDKDGKAYVVSVVSENHIWCVNKDHQIWHLENGKWTQVPTHSGKADARTLSAGADGTVWYTNIEDRLFRRESNAWHLDPDARATVVAVGSKDQVWCANREGKVFHLDSHGKWQKDSGASGARTLSVGADGTVWYGNAEERLFRREGNAWHQEPEARATVVAVGSKDQIWCVNAEGDAFQRTSQGKWQKVDQPKGSWEYKVKQDDGLYAIVRQQYKLTDEKEVQRIAGLVVTENHIQNKDKLAVNSVLRLLSY